VPNRNPYRFSHHRPGTSVHLDLVQVAGPSIGAGEGSDQLHRGHDNGHFIFRPGGQHQRVRPVSLHCPQDTTQPSTGSGVMGDEGQRPFAQPAVHRLAFGQVSRALSRKLCSLWSNDKNADVTPPYGAVCLLRHTRDRVHQIAQLFNRYRLGEVAWLIHINATLVSDMVRQQLQRQVIDKGLEQFMHQRHQNRVVGQRVHRAVLFGHHG